MTLPVTRERKQELLARYKEHIQKSQAVVVAEYRGLTVPQLQNLRRALRSANASFVIAKKTLMSLALTETGHPVPQQAMIGSVGFAFLGDDLAAGAKVLRDFAKEMGENFTIRGAVVGQSVLDAAGAAALAELPTREVQLGQLLGALAAPLTALVGLITGPHRDLIGLLQARMDKEGGAAAAA
jgi:large subunit ribosomal protein L10